MIFPLKAGHIYKGISEKPIHWLREASKVEVRAYQRWLNHLHIPMNRAMYIEHFRTPS